MRPKWTPLLPALALAAGLALCAVAAPASRVVAGLLEPLHPGVTVLGDSIIAEADLVELLGRRDVLNRGIGGDQSVNMPGRLVRDVLSKKPGILVIEGGINDIRSHVPVERIVQSKREIVAFCEANGIRPILMKTLFVGTALAVDPALDMREINRRVSALNEGITLLAGERGLAVLDLVEVLSEDGHLRVDMTRDGIHLNAQGYALFGRRLRELLRQD